MRKEVTSLVAVALFLSTTFGCGANEGILKSGKDSSPKANTASDKPAITEDINSMRTASFNYIFVLRRKDGGVMDAEDKSVIKLNTEMTNRRVSAEGDKAFVVGSNPIIPAYNMGVLEQRFMVENHSPKSIPVVNANK